MEVTITQISRKSKTSAAGKPYTSLGIKTQEHGEKWLSGFGNVANKDWKIGDKVEVEVTQKGEYLNFETPRAARGAGAGSEILGKLAELKNFNELYLRKELTELRALVGALSDRLDVFIDEDKIQPRF